MALFWWGWVQSETSIKTANFLCSPSPSHSDCVCWRKFGAESTVPLKAGSILRFIINRLFDPNSLISWSSLSSVYAASCFLHGQRDLDRFVPSAHASIVSQ